MPQDLSKLVLDFDVTRHEFRRAASIAGWTIRGFGTDLPDEPFEEAWGTRGQEHEVHFVEDPFIGLSYLLLEPAGRDVVLKELKGILHIWSTEEAINAARNSSSPQPRARLMRVIAVSASAVQEPATVAALRAGAHDEAVEVRESVVFGCGYMPTWPAMRDVLTEMAESDPAPALRADAQAMLETLNSDPEPTEQLPWAECETVKTLFKRNVPLSEFSAFAQASGWRMVDHLPAEPGRAEEFIWETASGVAVHRVNDETLGLSYTALTGNAAEAVAMQEAREALVSHFPAYDNYEPIRMYQAADGWDEKVILLPMIAATAPAVYDEEFFQTVRSALVDQHGDVRLGGVITTFYIPWPEFIEELNEMATEREPEEAVREAASEAIEFIRNSARSQ